MTLLCLKIININSVFFQGVYLIVDMPDTMRAHYVIEQEISNGFLSCQKNSREHG